MPRLSDLTDYNYDPMGSYTGGLALPVEVPVGVNNNVGLDLPVKFSPDPKLVTSAPLSNNVDKILNSIFRDDEKRLQLWPEKLIRNATTAAGRAMTGEIPQWSIDKDTGDVHTSPQMIEAAQEMAALAGTGGLAGTTEATLGATPFLRPALKHKERLYKGKEGQQHQDIIPDSLYNDFQKKAMNGEDLAEYNFGFVNDKGRFLSREDALKYAIDTGMIDKFAGKYGALTSTLLADSSKPGVAIEAMKRIDPVHFSSVDAAKFRLGQLQRDKATSKKAGDDVNSSDYMFYNTQIRALKDFIKNPTTKSDTPVLPPGYELKPVDFNPFENNK